MTMRSICLSLVAFATEPLFAVSQNNAALSKDQESLLHLLETHQDVIDKYFPDKEATEEYERYRVSYPPIEDYVISILVNPCGQNGTHGRDDDIALGYDCCISRFGAGEYGYRQGSRNVFSNGYSNGLPMSVDEPLHNIDLVDEFGNMLDYRYSRRADDIVYIDETCVGLREPHSACIADRFAASVNNAKPACWDYNETVDATLDCFTTNGKRHRNCMQVSYSQNAYIHVCGGEFANDDTCGTFLEIHKANGTPYDKEATILSDVRLTVHSTEGMQTTTLPLTYKGNPNRILCSYEELNIEVGSMVKVKGNTASCCCPRLLSPNRLSKIGAFFCPKRKSFRDGPFAPKLETLDELFLDDVFQTKFPFCPGFDDARDVLMCTHERVFADDIPLDRPERYFSMPCATLEMQDHDNTYKSDNLSGVYPNVCPLGGGFSACGLSSSSSGECQGTDFPFTFRDEIGKVVHLPKITSGKYGVTFNDGRSLYWFARDELEFLKPPGNYEVWFVKRNRFEKIVEKKKPFKVIWPRCTFDSANGRYFPWFSKNSTQTH